MAKETILNYPDFNEVFEIHTDASDRQLGAAISQNGKPLAFYSRKLNSAQKNYTTAEKELLSIIEMLKEFANILLGYKIIVHTDHKNLLYRPLPTQRLQRWRMLIEEYDCTFVHVSGMGCQYSHLIQIRRLRSLFCWHPTGMLPAPSV